MDKRQGDSPPPNTHAMTGYVLAIVSREGPFSHGYVGKLHNRTAFGELVLTGAWTITTILGQAPGGGLNRNVEAFPMEFSKGLDTVRCRPLAEFDLSELHPDEVQLYENLLRDAKAIRDSIRINPRIAIAQPDQGAPLPAIIMPGGGR